MIVVGTNAGAEHFFLVLKHSISRISRIATPINNPRSNPGIIYQRNTFEQDSTAIDNACATWQSK